jgi:hypothetical protein
MPKVSRKAYVLVLGVAAIGLVADRVFLGGPKEAKAEMIPDTLSVPASERGGVAITGAASDTAAGRLAGFALALTAPRGDLGAVPAWLVVKAEEPAKVTAEQGKPWIKRHRVSGFSRGQTNGVSIDGNFVKVGEIVDGMMLTAVSVETGEAVFADEAGVQARLPLPGFLRE